MVLREKVSLHPQSSNTIDLWAGSMLTTSIYLFASRRKCRKRFSVLGLQTSLEGLSFVDDVAILVQKSVVEVSAASAGEQGSDFAFLAVVVSRLVPTEILAAFWLVLGLQASSGALSFDDVVGMML